MRNDLGEKNDLFILVNITAKWIIVFCFYFVFNRTKSTQHTNHSKDVKVNYDWLSLHNKGNLGGWGQRRMIRVCWKMKVDQQKSGFIKSRIELNCLFEIILCLTQNQASMAINQLHEVDVESVEM